MNYRCYPHAKGVPRHMPSWTALFIFRFDHKVKPLTTWPLLPAPPPPLTIFGSVLMEQ